MSVEKKIQELLKQSKVLSEEVEQDEEVISEEEVKAEKGAEQPDNKKAVDGAGAANGKQTAKGAEAAGKKAMAEEKCEDDDEDEDEDDDKEVVKMKEGKYKMKKEDRDIKVDVSEDVAALTSDETLSEEFKTKAATIFEAAVVARVKQELATIEEEFEARLNEEVQQVTEGLVDKVDGYLDYVVEQWMKQNEIALEAGLKSEITENFIGGLKSLFEEHYIDIPEEKYDLVGELEQRAADTEEKLNEAVAQSIELKKQLDEHAKKEIVGELKAGLTETEVEKFTSLAAEIVFESADSYKEKLTTIRESYFKSEKSEVKGGVEDEASTAEQKVMVESVARYAQALGKFKK